MVREVCVVGGWGSVQMCNYVLLWMGREVGGEEGAESGMCGWRMG